MVCLGFEPGAAKWKAQTNPLSYGGTPTEIFISIKDVSCIEVTYLFRLLIIVFTKFLNLYSYLVKYCPLFE